MVNQKTWTSLIENLQGGSGADTVYWSPRPAGIGRANLGNGTNADDSLIEMPTRLRRCRRRVDDGDYRRHAVGR